MKPSKFEWMIAIVLFLFLFASWGHGDTRTIVGYEIDFADSIVHGEFANFYQRSYERARTGSRDYPYYDLPINVVLGIWGLPLYLLGGTEYEGNFFKILYGKSLFFFVFLICAFLVYKICREFDVDEDKSQWAAFIYFTSTMAINSICLIGNCDTLGATLILAGVLAYVRHKNFQCFLWFLIAFPFKQHALFIYLPLLLLRDKNIFRVSFKLILFVVFNFICNLPIYSTPGAVAKKNWFTLWMAERFMVNTIPFLSGNLPVFMLLYGLLCAFCYITYKYDDEKSLTLIIATLSITITLSSISSNPNWYLQLAPYLAIACVYYSKAAKDVMLFETIGSLALLGYNYIQYNDSYKSNNAISMFLYKLLVKPVYENSAKFSYENSIISDVSNTALNTQQSLLRSVIRVPKAACGSIYTISIIILVFFLFRASNVDTESRINYRPYALARMSLNIIACCIPLMIFVIEALR